MISPLFNIPYCPQFNGIESVFSIIKQDYKKMALKKILNSQKYHPKDLISKAVKNLAIEKVRNCIENSLK
jgi:hypothetical protein